MAALMEVEGPPPLPASPPPFANHDLDGEQTTAESNREKFRSLQKMVSALLSPQPQSPDDPTAPPPKRQEIESKAESEPPKGPKLVHPTHGRPKRALVRPPSRALLRSSGTDLSIGSPTKSPTRMQQELPPSLEVDNSSLVPASPSTPPPPPPSDLPPPASTDETDGTLDTTAASSSSFLLSQPPADSLPQRHSTPIPSAISAQLATTPAETSSVLTPGSLRRPSFFSISSSRESPSTAPSFAVATPGRNNSADSVQAGKGSAVSGANRTTPTSNFMKKIQENREKRVTGKVAALPTRESPIAVRGPSPSASKQPPPQLTARTPEAVQDAPLSPSSNLEGTKDAKVKGFSREPDTAEKSDSVDAATSPLPPSSSSSSLLSLRLRHMRENRLQKAQTATPPVKTLLPLTAAELSSPTLFAVSSLPSALSPRDPNLSPAPLVLQQVELGVSPSKVASTPAELLTPANTPVSSFLPRGIPNPNLPLSGLPPPHAQTAPPPEQPKDPLPTEHSSLILPKSPSSLPPELRASLTPEPPSLPPELPAFPPPELPAFPPPELPAFPPPELPAFPPPELPAFPPPELPAVPPPELPAFPPPELPAFPPPELPAFPPPEPPAFPSPELLSSNPPKLPSTLPSTLPPELPSTLPPKLPSSPPPGLPSSPPPQLSTSPSSDLFPLSDVSVSFTLSPPLANQDSVVSDLSTSNSRLAAAHPPTSAPPSAGENPVVLRRAQQQKQQEQQGSKEGSQRQRWSSAAKRLSLAEARELISASRLPPSAAPLKRWTALDTEHSENASTDNSALSRETSPKVDNLEQPYVAKTAGSVNRRSRTGPLHQILDELSASSSSSNILFNQHGHEPDMKSTSAVSLDKVAVTPLSRVHTEEARSLLPSLAFGSSSSPPSPPPSSLLELPSLPPPQGPPPSPPPSSSSPLSKMHLSSSQEPKTPPPQRSSSPPPLDPPSPPPLDPPSPPPLDPPSPPPLDPPTPPPLDPPTPPPLDPPTPRPLDTPPLDHPEGPHSPPTQEPSSSPQNDECEAQVNMSTKHSTASIDASKEEKSGRRAVKSMISISSLRRKDLESDLEPMSTALDALIVMQEKQDEQIENNLAEMKRHQLLTKGLLEWEMPQISTAGIIPPSLSEKPQEWPVESVCHWMETVGLGSYEDMFREANINGDILVQLDNEALVDLGIQNPNARCDLLSKIKNLDSSCKGDVEELALMPLLIPPDEAEYGGRPHSKSSETTPPKATPSNLDVVDALLSPVNEEQYSVGNKSSLQGPVLDYTREPSVETQRRSTSNAAQLKGTAHKGTAPQEHGVSQHGTPPGQHGTLSEEEHGLVRLFMDTIQSTIYYKAFAATITTTSADLIKQALSKVGLVEDPNTFYILQRVLPICSEPEAIDHVLESEDCPLALQKNWSSYDGFRFELRRKESAEPLEIDIKPLMGYPGDPNHLLPLLLSPHTSCSETLALLHTRLRLGRRSCALVEVNLNTGVERTLEPAECPMATKQRWMGAPHLMKLVPKDAARNQEPPGGSGDKTDLLRPRRHSSHVEKLQAQLSELELEKETLTRHLCSTKVKLQRLESTEVDSSSLNEAHRALTNMVKSQQESHRREIRELQGQLEGLTLANRQLREMQLVASASSPQGQALGEIQKRYNQEVVSLKEQLGSMEKSLQTLEIKNKQLEEELAGKTREVEQLTALVSSSKQMVESLERDLGTRESALRLVNLKLKDAESAQSRLSEGDSHKVNTLLATISTQEMTLEATNAESQRQALELQASRRELGLVKMHLADKEKQLSQIQVGSKRSPSLFARMSMRSPQIIITLELKPTDQGLGIKVANAPTEVGGCVVKGTALYCQTDQLRHGDKLLEVNEVDVSAMNHNELGDLLQKSSSSVIRLVVGRLVPMEGLIPPTATSPLDPKWSSLKHKVSPPKALDGLTEVAELKDKCRRLQADLIEQTNSKKAAETEQKQLHTTIQNLSSQLSDAQASLKTAESNLSKDKLYLDRLLTIVVEQAPHLLSMMEEGSLESDYPESDDNSWC